MQGDSSCVNEPSCLLPDQTTLRKGCAGSSPLGDVALVGFLCRLLDPVKPCMDLTRMSVGRSAGKSTLGFARRAQAEEAKGGTNAPLGMGVPSAPQAQALYPLVAPGCHTYGRSTLRCLH